MYECKQYVYTHISAHLESITRIKFPIEKGSLYKCLFKFPRNPHRLPSEACWITFPIGEVAVA